ncbi:MAG: hypothetical protein V3V01_08165 [Acidimicrobiales bacterium]
MTYSVFEDASEATRKLQSEYSGFVDEYNAETNPLTLRWSFGDVNTGIAQVDAVQSDCEFVYVGSVASSLLIALDRETGREIARITNVSPAAIAADGARVVIADGNIVRSLPRPDFLNGWSGLNLGNLEQWTFDHGGPVRALKSTGPHVFLGGDPVGAVTVRRLDAVTGLEDWQSAVHATAVNTIDSDGVSLIIGGVRDPADDAVIRLLTYEAGTAVTAAFAGAPAFYADVAAVACLSLTLGNRHVIGIIDKATVEIVFLGTDMVTAALPSWVSTFGSLRAVTKDGRGHVFLAGDPRVAANGARFGSVFEMPEDKPAASAAGRVEPMANGGNGTPLGNGTNQLAIDCDGFGVFTGGLATPTGAVVHRFSMISPVQLVRRSTGRYRWPFHKALNTQNPNRSSFARIS